MNARVLIICTGNSCRSQMAEGFLSSMDAELQVVSAGIKPEKTVNPFAIRVMEEAGIDISKHQPKLVDNFVKQDFDYVITVCGGAKEVCPFFSGSVKHRLHMGFDDPADARGTEEEKLLVYRKIRDEIKAGFTRLYQEYIIQPR